MKNRSLKILRVYVMKLKLLRRAISYEKLQSCYSLVLQSTNVSELMQVSSKCFDLLATCFISVYKIKCFTINICK